VAARQPADTAEISRRPVSAFSLLFLWAGVTPKVVSRFDYQQWVESHHSLKPPE
jgi:hypothetical protein